jgi:hypothetical protein
MGNSYEKRLAALEQAMMSIRPTIGVFMPDPEMNPDEFLDELIKEGKLARTDRHRVLVVRFWSSAEADASLARERADRDSWKVAADTAALEAADVEEVN